MSRSSVDIDSPVAQREEPSWTAQAPGQIDSGSTIKDSAGEAGRDEEAQVIADGNDCGDAPPLKPRPSSASTTMSVRTNVLPPAHAKFSAFAARSRRLSAPVLLKRSASVGVADTGRMKVKERMWKANSVNLVGSGRRGGDSGVGEEMILGEGETENDGKPKIKWVGLKRKIRYPLPKDFHRAQTLSGSLIICERAYTPTFDSKTLSKEKHRFVVIKEDRIFILKKQGDGYASEVLELEDCTVDPCPPGIRGGRGTWGLYLHPEERQDSGITRKNHHRRSANARGKEKSKAKEATKGDGKGKGNGKGSAANGRCFVFVAPTESAKRSWMGAVLTATTWKGRQFARRGTIPTITVCDTDSQSSSLSECVFPFQPTVEDMQGRRWSVNSGYPAMRRSYSSGMADKVLMDDVAILEEES
ncbi:hypothetical protein HDU85_001553 [Gaertneriomyces sp. JEL0708]|nr:hypothetical protein HDU85_001553 [Gaertneriomyces sp. JEL0708]